MEILKLKPRKISAWNLRKAQTEKILRKFVIEKNNWKEMKRKLRRNFNEISTKIDQKLTILWKVLVLKFFIQNSIKTSHFHR